MKLTLNKRIWCLLSLSFVIAQQANAQHQELNEKPAVWKSDTSADIQPTLSNLFKRASFSGHFRYFFMATDNEKGLTDYYANAIGGGLRMETLPWHGLSLTVSGFYVFNLGSSDFTQADPLSGQRNRYEIGLFDLTEPSNKNNIDRLEELHLRYQRKSVKLTLGKQLINTPFINLQDGRMRPTGVNGLYAEGKIKRNTQWEFALLQGISPRGTSRWYTIGESIGLYSQGVNPDGSKSNYANHVPTRFVAQVGIKHLLQHQLQVDLWSLYIDRLMHTSMIQIDKEWKRPSGSWHWGLQSIQQFSLTQSTSGILPGQYYIEPHARSFSAGMQLVYKKKAHTGMIQYNRITTHGRYLMPREWGRDPFYTFMPRERNEGMGDVHAWVGRYQYQKSQSSLMFTLGAGYVHSPEPNNYRLNKYGMPSYMQAFADVRYKCKGMLKGLELQALVTGKRNGDSELKKQYVFNKVNVMNYNVSVNYRF